MHYVVTDKSNILQQCREHTTIGFQVELCPDLRMLKQSNVIAECEVVDMVVRFLDRVGCGGKQFEICNRELVSEELADVKFDLPQKKKWFGQRLKLEAKIACGHHARYSAI